MPIALKIPSVNININTFMNNTLHLLNMGDLFPKCDLAISQTNTCQKIATVQPQIEISYRTCFLQKM